MKIKEITKTYIKFTNNSQITFNHDQDCCEYNYASFEDLEELALDYEFDEHLQFERSMGGFRFGDDKMMFYIPCYSMQNGYYSTDIDIYYNNRLELEAICEYY